MKKWGIVLLCVLLMSTFVLFALGSGDSGEDTNVADQGSGQADKDEATKDNTTLGDYTVDIVSCRLAKDYSGEAVVIVKYNFVNNSDKAASFGVTFKDEVYQDGVGLNKAYILQESAKYSSDNQMKDIKPGASLEVEVAYELNDTETDIQVEVEELFSFNDKIISKTFSIK